MSERQAKKKRICENLIEDVKETPANKGKILFNVVSGVLILAFLGLAAWGIVKNKSNAPQNNLDNISYEEMDDSLAAMAEQQGLTYEEFAEKFALSPETFGPTSSYEESIDIFTLDTISRIEGATDINTYIEEKGLPKDVDITIANGELPTDVMMKVYRITETLDELKEYGIPAEITGSTKWFDAKDYVLNAQQAKLTAEMSATEDGGAE